MKRKTTKSDFSPDLLPAQANPDGIKAVPVNVKQATDIASIIRGQEVGKRAVMVAAAGFHSLTLIGPPGNGKSMLRNVFASLVHNGIDSYESNPDLTCEYWPCPCGYANSPTRECHCTAEEILAHKRTIVWSQVNCEVPHLPFRELASRTVGTSLREMQEGVDGARKFGDNLLTPKVWELCNDGQALLKAAYGELGLDPCKVSNILKVARTIANLDKSELVYPHHLNEAINYVAFDR